MNFISVQTIRRSLVLALALGGAGFGAATVPASAQVYGPPPPWAAPYYNASRHILNGVITYSAPYRINLRVGPPGPRGHSLPIDLKNGTVILPTGTTLVPGMRVHLRGYWSRGTFIANRVRVI
ncbi:MAG: hypothetical protein ACREM2_01165 [Vulcanimicrobiaceae bacterium]